MKNKLFHRFAALTALAGVFAVVLTLMSAPTFAQQPQPSPGHVVQRASNLVFAEAGQVDCWLLGPLNETVAMTCNLSRQPGYNKVFVFVIGACASDSYGGVSWTVCRPGDNVYTWDVTANNLEKTGDLF